MTNADKRELRILCKEGDSFKEIREQMDCADSTIRSYMKLFSPKRKTIKVVKGEG